MTSERMLLLEVWESIGGVVTVATNYGGGGTRLCGVKLHGSGSRKVVEFYLSEQAVRDLVADMDRTEIIEVDA